MPCSLAASALPMFPSLSVGDAAALVFVAALGPLHMFPSSEGPQ